MKTPPLKHSSPGILGLAAMLAGVAVIFGLATGNFWETVWPANRSVTPNARGQSMSTDPSSALEHIRTDNFAEKVLHAKGPVLVDFYADWCRPCQRLAPLLEELSKETAHAKIVKVNVDENPELAAKYRIESIPHLLVFRDGKVTGQHTGLADRASLQQLLE